MGFFDKAHLLVLADKYAKCSYSWNLKLITN
jgi:hypothetical protein